MNLRLNGEDHQFESGQTIQQLLKQLGLHADRVVLELNQSVLTSTDSIHIELHEGDNLEIIQFVGGG